MSAQISVSAYAYCYPGSNRVVALCSSAATPGKVKPFVAQATEEELSSSATRDVAASAPTHSQPPFRMLSSPRGSKDSIAASGGVQQEESSERKSSHLVPGTTPSNPPPNTPEKSETETEAGWLRSLVMVEKEEKRKIQSKLDELHDRKGKLEKKFHTKNRKFEALEKEAKETQSQLIQEQQKYTRAMEELRAKKAENDALKQSLEKKDGELKMQKQKLTTQKSITELNRVLEETSRRIQELKEDWKKDRQEVNVAREEKVIIQNFLNWTDRDVKHYKGVVERIKSLEKQRNIALFVVVFIIIPLVIAHVLLV